MAFLKITNKRCSKCNKVKPSDNFSKANTKPGGLQPRCKVCISKYTKKGYQTTAMTYRTKDRYKRDWSIFFKNEYGRCQICDVKLSYTKNDKVPTVTFDHRHGNEFIKCKPSSFVRTHPCNDKYMRIWRACDFGILCRRCNAVLPTKNRTAWLTDVVQYVGAL